MPPVGDLAHNPGMCPDWESKRWYFGSKAALNLLSHTTQGRSTFLLKTNIYQLVVLNSLFNNITAKIPIPGKLCISNMHQTGTYVYVL